MIFMAFLLYSFCLEIIWNVESTQSERMVLYIRKVNPKKLKVYSVGVIIIMPSI